MVEMKAATIGELLRILARLDAARIHWALRRTRPDAVSVDVSIPGHRWEIDVLEDGSIEVEVFTSNGTIGDAELLAKLIDENAD